MRRAMFLAVMSMVALVVASGAALAVARVGTPGDDRLRGTNGSDALSGLGGDDVLLGLKGSDAMDGGAGRDAVLGGNEFGPQAGDRSIDGGPGGDFVGGGRGPDALKGGTGKDFLFAGPFNENARDVDSISAGDGNDAVTAFNRPAARDIIACGSGFDQVLVDGKDVTKDCERKFTSPNRFFNSISPNYFAPLNNL